LPFDLFPTGEGPPPARIDLVMCQLTLDMSQSILLKYAVKIFYHIGEKNLTDSRMTSEYTRWVKKPARSVI